ncbi:hypothetical protein [Antarcticirhabdus aurantiaca]|uniref:Uncharacterized protein n=1 Tax=Antarcticirhabdus aurantiaca TaxID=2606717 RepID=A0ACD4NND7_9HYPH|nr:hypothetical protein [Antarcticirhabdus aurantiaca]WAJ28249.1 hypothetical protein OXU80_26090 [Jeongeuplla avenae]
MTDDPAWPPVLHLKLSDGTLCEIVELFDLDGDETDDPEMAFSVVARHPDGTWLAHAVEPVTWDEDSALN